MVSPLRVPGELLVPAATNPSSTPRIPSHIHPQGPPGLDPCILVAGCRTPDPGATLQWPAQSNCPHGQDTYNCRARQAGQRISRQSKTSLHIGRDSTRYQQPTSPAPQQSSETCYHDNSASKDYSLRAHSTLPGSVQYLSSLLRGGLMWGHPLCSSPSPVHFSAIQYSNTLSPISLCNSSLRSQLQTKRSFPTRHLSKSIHSTSHAY